LHEPQVLLLDEPASGLDPRARIEMRELLKELRNMGKTILVSSHILPELADICNKIGIIERGKLLFDGDVASAIRQVRQRTVMKVVVGEGRNNEAAGQLRDHSSIDTVELKVDGHGNSDGHDEFMVVTLKDGINDGSFIADVLVRNGFRLRMLQEEEIDLEDVFMGITKGITN
jgi:ABC-2 type transport system ATP-binding protein